VSVEVRSTGRTNAAGSAYYQCIESAISSIACRMQRITIKTRRKREVLDITDTVEDLLSTHHPDKSGICNLLILHTTAALTTADLDPGTDLDMLDAFEAMIPKLRYRHPHNPAHVPDHILSALIGTSVGLPFNKGKIILGTWQRVILVELDGPREREIVTTMVCE
jgi:secondary thiamine-phosphate synthase enzyme